MQKIALITDKNRFDNFTYEERANISERIALLHALNLPEVREARMKSKSAAKLASILCARIERPRALNRVAHFLPGKAKNASGQFTGGRNENTSAMMSKERKLSEGNYDRFISRRMVARKEIKLSPVEREEVFGVVKNILLITAFEFEKVGVKKRVPKFVWKLIFAEVRQTIGVQRIMSRMEPIDTMTDHDGELTQDMAIGQIVDRIESREEQRAKRDAICSKLRNDQACLLAAFMASKSRKARKVFEGFMSFSVVAARAALGYGHGMVTYDAAQKLAKRYREHVAHGACLLASLDALPSVEALCNEMFIRHEREKTELQNRLEGLEMMAIQS